MPAVAGEEPLLGLAPESAPVDAQFFEQLRAEHDIAVLAALAFPDMDHHPLAVDVADLQVGRFRAACAGGIERHQKDAMKGGIRGFNQSRNLLLADRARRIAAIRRAGASIRQIAAGLHFSESNMRHLLWTLEPPIELPGTGPVQPD